MFRKVLKVVSIMLLVIVSMAAGSIISYKIPLKWKFREEVEKEEIINKLVNLGYQVENMVLLDSRYIAYDVDTTKDALIGSSSVILHRYRDDFFDCDDFALTTLGITKLNLDGVSCFFIGLLEDHHAIIGCYTYNGSIIFYDPEAMKFINPKKQPVVVVG